jgi:hypothetical protein
MTDIRIVEEYHVQPTLFGSPLVEIVYHLVDWNTEQPINEERYKSLADAERAICRIVAPHLRQMAFIHAERN